MSVHDMCGNEITDTDGTRLGCMRSAGHEDRVTYPHYDASENRSWTVECGQAMVWDGSGGIQSARFLRVGRTAQ